MPINDEELLAAVSGATDSVVPKETAATEETTDEHETADTSADGSTDGDGTSGSEADGEPDGKPEGDAKADGEGDADDAADAELGPDGKPVVKAGAKDAKTDEIDPATGKPFTPEQVAEKKAAKAREDFLAEQERDPVNAPIPKYLKEPTQKRMRALVDIAKDLTTKHETAMKDRNEIIGMITDTGANAQQYRGVLNYLSLVNSGDPAKIQQAITVMQQELQILSRAAGIPVVGVDHLAEHADLKAEIAAGKLTEERAQEIAANRNRTKFHNERQQQHTQLTQQQQEQKQLEHTAGVSALNKIGKQLALKDPNYRTKAVEVLESIKADMQKAPPSEWAQLFLVAYTTHKPAAPVVVRKAPVVPKNQPLRGNNPSGGQQKAPASLEEAINFGIAAGTRR